MAVNSTPYLELPYGEGGDTGFRDLYGQSMEKVDNLFPDAQSIRYPNEPRSIFDDGIVTPGSPFELRTGSCRYAVLGNRFFFEFGFELKNATNTIPANGDINNTLLCTINAQFPRKRGFFVTGINGIPAHYSYSGTAPAQILVTSYGGGVAGKVIPKGTFYAVAGHYFLTD